MSGWIKLHRSLRDNPYMNRPAYRAVWLELLIEAEHGMKKQGDKYIRKSEKEMKSIIWKGKRIYLKPGQLTCGAEQLSEWTGVPRGTVERILKVFKNEEQIEVQTSNRFSLITVLNWNKYQQNEEQNEEPMRNQRGTNEEPVRTPKECKNEKNVKNEIDINVDKSIDDSTSKLKLEFKELLTRYENGTGTKLRSLKDRQAKYKNRRQVFSKEELVRALDIMLDDDFLQGDNDSNKRYGDLDYLLRNDKTVEKLLNNTNAKCKQNNGPSALPSALSIEI